MKVEVYLVGDDKANENNQWLAMCATIEDRDRLLVELGGTTTKTIQVGPPPKRRNKNARN